MGGEIDFGNFGLGIRGTPYFCARSLAAWNGLAERWRAL
jgi:hypothetical protein